MIYVTKSMIEEVILIDEHDTELGRCEKLEAHKLGLLHRAFSILVFNSNGDYLLQRRALDKYHCGGLWSNACCSHPRPGERVIDAAHRRLKEEMGFDCGLEEFFKQAYKFEFRNGLTENEIDHVLIGNYDGDVKINPKEVAEYKWVSSSTLLREVAANPERYTPWFREILKKRSLDKVRFKNKLS